jgi:hypothetical protein
VWRPEELRARLRRQPFQPLVLLDSLDARYEIRHPELVMVGERSLTIGIPSPTDPAIYTHTVCISLEHVWNAHMAKFLFVYRSGKDARTAMSPEEMQQILQKWNTWIAEGVRQGWMLDPGDALKPEGRVVNARKVITDGPFVEAKEIVVGLSIVQAAFRSFRPPPGLGAHRGLGEPDFHFARRAHKNPPGGPGGFL